MSPETIARLQVAMQRYREAFDQTQVHLRAAGGPQTPQWVFALDKLTLGEVREYGILLAEAEEKRRTARTALHAIVELLALHGDGISGQDPTTWIATESAGTSDEHAWHDALDRFISVVNYAREAGVIYVNGDFRPSDDAGSDSTDEWSVPDFAAMGMANAAQERIEE
ncbi:MAG: hypothetical protein EP330_16595 [Deltaproteobacteria bacterium]|nr:MAG: hypothetical protein EP330_16595 [Deltaproteobacteria bacterium]